MAEKVETDLTTLPLDNLPWWAPGVVVLLFGLLTCLHGYKILKVVLFLLGLTSGAYAGLLYAPLLFPEQPNLVWITAGVLGFALGILMNFFYKPAYSPWVPIWVECSFCRFCNRCRILLRLGYWCWSFWWAGLPP